MSRGALLVLGTCRACPCRSAPETDELPVCQGPVPTRKQNLADERDAHVDTRSTWIDREPFLDVLLSQNGRNLATQPYANHARNNTHEQNNHALNTNLPRTMLHQTEKERPITNHDSTVNQPQNSPHRPTVICEPIKTTSTPRSNQEPTERAPLIETFTNQPITRRCLQMDQP